MPPWVDTILRDIEVDAKGLANNARAAIRKFEHLRLELLKAASSDSALTDGEIAVGEIARQVDAAAAEAKASADLLSDPEKIGLRLKEIRSGLAEIDLVSRVKAARDPILDEINRLKERERIELVKSTVATASITNKVKELSEESITEVIRDSFTRETERLKLQRVAMAMTRGEKGALLHQPKLVGAVQSVPLPRVLSEGERTALGLAAMIMEAELDTSHSAIILDDPVTSLDHVRRAAVASRLAQLAQLRQVIVFTHDVAFVADLKREANGVGVPVSERFVARGHGVQRKPGMCSEGHPWKAKDVAQRIGELERDLSRITKQFSTWDTATYEDQVGLWAGNLSETWERIISHEILGSIFAEGGLEVRPKMIKILVKFSETDEREFNHRYSRVSQWAKRHDKSDSVNYVCPEVSDLRAELDTVKRWFGRIRAYKN